MNNQRHAIILLKIGLSFVFLYTAFHGLYSPELYAVWVPSRVAYAMGPYLNFFLYGFFLLEFFLALFVFSKTWSSRVAIVMAFLLIIITAMNYAKLDILFRNIGLICMALALYVIQKK